MKQKLRTALGVFLIVLAVITGPIPIIQGWMFFVAAIGVLGIEHPIIQWCLDQMRRFPFARKALDKLGIPKKAGDYPPGGPSTDV